MRETQETSFLLAPNELLRVDLAQVELTLRLQLVDSRAKRVLATRLLDENENAPSDDAYGGVIAANAPLQRALEQLADLCVLESGNR